MENIMDLIKPLLLYLVARFGEASTWASLVAWVAAELQVRTSAEFNTAVVHLGLAAAALAGVLIKEGVTAK
jgi:hypothetical protein